MTRVLVGYASRFRSTREVAMRIADRLRGHGHEVTVSAVDGATSVDGYGAVVIGSGVYDGAWTAGATAFLWRQALSLAAMPVWLFSVGSSRSKGRPRSQGAAFQSGPGGDPSRR